MRKSKKHASRTPSSLRSSKKSTTYYIIHFAYLLPAFLIAIFLYNNNAFEFFAKPHVLGTTSYLAKGGSDDSGSGSSGDGNSVSSGSSGGSSGSTGGSAGSGSSGSSGSSANIESSGSSSGPLENSGKTESENKTESIGNTEKIEPQESEVKTSFGNDMMEVKTKTEEGKMEIKIRQAGTKFELKTENGKVTVKAKAEDGTETQLEESDALEKINAELENDGLDISTTSAGMVVRHGQIEAQTHFPLSIDLATNSLIVTTPAGTKSVTVLPDEAVKSLIDLKFITVISTPSGTLAVTESGSLTATPSAGTVLLTELNKEPVFEVHGKKEKKFLGFVPVGINKTAFVSAQTGQIVKTDVSFFDSLLEAISL